MKCRRLLYLFDCDIYSLWHNNNSIRIAIYRRYLPYASCLALASLGRAQLRSFIDVATSVSYLNTAQTMSFDIQLRTPFARTVAIATLSICDLCRSDWLWKMAPTFVDENDPRFLWILRVKCHFSMEIYLLCGKIEFHKGKFDFHSSKPNNFCSLFSIMTFHIEFKYYFDIEPLRGSP